MLPLRGLLLLAISALCAGCSASGQRHQGFPSSSAAVFTRDREEAERCNTSGLAHAQQRAFSAAEVEFRKALEADPFFGPAYCNLGLVQLELDKPFEAAWNLRHASQLMPRASQPRANLGLLFERVGRLDSAEASLRDALRESPDDIEVIGHLARVQVKRSKVTAETLAWLGQVASEHPDPAWRDWARTNTLRTTTPSNSFGEQR